MTVAGGRRERRKERAAKAPPSAAERTATQTALPHRWSSMTGFETRVCVPGHMQRKRQPSSAYDRVLAHGIRHLCRQAGRGG